MGGGTGAGVFADGPQPATSMKTMVEANTARMQIMTGRPAVTSSESTSSQSSTPSTARRGKLFQLLLERSRAKMLGYAYQCRHHIPNPLPVTILVRGRPNGRSAPLRVRRQNPACGVDARIERDVLDSICHRRRARAAVLLRGVVFRRLMAGRRGSFAARLRFLEAFGLGGGLGTARGLTGA